MFNFARRHLFQSAAAGAALAILADAPQAQAASLLYVIAEIVSKPDTADQLRALLVPFAKSSAREHGCLHYSLLEDEKQPGRFLTYETWTGQPALDAHMKTPALAALAPKLGDLLAKPFTQNFLTKLTG